MQRSALWLVVAGILVLACGPSEPPAEKAPVEEVGVKQKEGLPARPQVATDKALVQVVIYGLAGFHLQHDAQGNLTGLSTHFPMENTAPHVLGLDRGVFNGQYRWEEITQDDAGEDIDLPESTIRFKMGGNLAELKTANPTLGDYPADADEAADVRWMLQAKEFDNPTAFNPNNATLRLNFSNGTLETCALVLPADSQDNVCRIKIKNKTRSASEVMVVRGLVPKNAAKVEVEIAKGGVTQTVSVRATGGPTTVTWNNEIYDTVINVGIRNADLGNPRTMVTSHGKHLKAFFSGTAADPWDISTPDCTWDPQHGTWTCSGCKPSRQPACWTYFAPMFKNTPSGYDRPICPFIGWTS